MSKKPMSVHMKAIRLICAIAFFVCAFTPLFSLKKAKSKDIRSLIFEISYGDGDRESIPLVPFDSIPDSSSVRRSVAKTWLLSSPEEVLALEEQIYYDDHGKGFKFMAVDIEERGEIAIVMSPVNTDFTTPSVDFVPQGTWVLYKDRSTGKPISLKIYPRENPELYLRLTPAREDMTYIDVCLFNAYVKYHYPIGLPFNTLCYFSISQLRSFTKDALPWGLFNPPIFSSTVENCSDIISDKLDTLVFVDDGLFDEWGIPIHFRNGKKQTPKEFVYLAETGQDVERIVGGVGSQGFLKWIVDGMIRPVAGQGIFVSSLMTQTEEKISEFNETFDHKAIFLGLDWIRNLAAAALTMNLKRTCRPQTSGVDVRLVPFAGYPVTKTFHDTGELKYECFEGCLSSAGYQVGYLQALLYYLAVMEPGHFAVNREVGSPPLRQYNHVVSFFPYFDALGAFHIDVYESAKKTTMSRFVSMNGDAFVALTRVKAPERGQFNP